MTDTPPHGTPIPEADPSPQHDYERAPDPPPPPPPPPAAYFTPPPQPVQVVNFAKLFGTLVSAIVAAVAILATFSQLTGYSAYTGDELESHRAERIQQQLRDAQQGLDSGGADPGSSDYDKCIAEPSTTVEECVQRFPDQVP